MFFFSTPAVWVVRPSHLDQTPNSEKLPEGKFSERPQNLLNSFVCFFYSFVMSDSEGYDLADHSWTEVGEGGRKRRRGKTGAAASAAAAGEGARDTRGAGSSLWWPGQEEPVPPAAPATIPGSVSEGYLEAYRFSSVEHLCTQFEKR